MVRLEFAHAGYNEALTLSLVPPAPTEKLRASFSQHLLGLHISGSYHSDQSIVFHLSTGVTHRQTTSENISRRGPFGASAALCRPPSLNQSSSSVLLKTRRYTKLTLPP